MKRCHTACLLYVLSVFPLPFLTAPSWATTVLHQSFPDLVQKADTIVVGTVSAIAAEWDAAQGRPYTLITLTDLDVRKGTAEDPLTLRLLGGPAPDGRTLHVSGVPDFHLGERVLLFVAGNERVAVPLVGMWQGLYRIVYDPERDEEMVYTSARQPFSALPPQRGGIVYDNYAAPLDHDHDHQRDTDHGDPLPLGAVLDAITQEVNSND